MWSPYEHMRGKYAKKALSWIHFWECLNVILSRIQLKGFPENILSTDTMLYLATNGTVGCAKFPDGKYWTFPGSYTGEYWGQTVPSEYMGTLPNVGTVRGNAGNAKTKSSIRGRVGKDIAVGWNNATHTPDLILMQTADILGEIDISEHCNVLYARYMRIPKAHNEQEKQAIQTAIKAILNGQLETIVSNNVHADELINGIKSEPFLDLTDVDKIDKLQYLDQYRKAVIRRFYEYAGQKVPVGPKMAQMSVKEAGANDSISLIQLLDHFEHVKKFCDECNRLFGWNTSAELTECFADEVKEMREEGIQNGDGNISDQGDRLGSAGSSATDTDTSAGDSTSGKS